MILQYLLLRFVQTFATRIPQTRKDFPPSPGDGLHWAKCNLEHMIHVLYLFGECMQLA